ncbi:hypothetical protein BGW38_008783 [Lunasporangiospora selenospora]|uniref:Uncharacterized protein n=1 Tax=Lunasporangiospora selenospora TaxID=979761 RepID=A0A9P6FZU9_9FUNG|nr:hypothetical protein BGW38_008783 [Lunasporangiospora selenospora]
MEPVLDPHVMAMDAFQLHNGVTPFNNYNDQYDQSQEYDTNAQAGNINEANGHSYLTSAPGSYPSEPYGNRGYGPLDGDSASDLELMMTDDGGSGYAAPTSIGFVYANEKRFSDFHALFRSVPDEEKLIEGNSQNPEKEENEQTE